MFQTAGYPAHPPYFSSPYEYRSPPQTPPNASGATYYSPRQYVYSTTPSTAKTHQRRATGDGTAKYTYSTYTTPRKPTTTYTPTQEYTSTPATGYHASAQSTPQRKSDYVPIYTTAESAQRPRPRRSSYTTKPSQPQTRTSRPSTAPKSPPPKATAEDAQRARIPAGYSYKNWDPTEEPILLLGSVFDANSLGKWIYDWTVFYYGPATPMTEVAGDLWLLLIHLAGKIKRAEDCVDRIRKQTSRETVDEFLDSGERLWRRFSKLLKICEEYMWRAAKKESGDAKNITMGRNSGCEFVDAIFGRDRELERTEKLMTGMRLWSMRFDANCEDILRNPGA